MTTTTATDDKTAVLARICDEIRRRRRFLITSHTRPDGDAIGSELAMACALTALGNQVRVVNRDPPPPPLLAFPGVKTIERAEAVDGDVDAAIVMECSDLARTGLGGLERVFLINLDHHPGNAGFGAINWFDGTAAACGEMVFDVIVALGVPLSKDIATYIYLAILTDTGSFHHSNISSRTFEICRQVVAAGVDPAAVARLVFENDSLGKLKLFGAVLNAIELDESGTLALLFLDRDIARAAGGDDDDTEGLINLPLSVREIQAVAFFRHIAGDEYRVSMRSKGAIDARQVAKAFGGGGHTNAAGCTISGPFEQVRAAVRGRLLEAIAQAPAPFDRLRANGESCERPSMNDE